MSEQDMGKWGTTPSLGLGLCSAGEKQTGTVYSYDLADCRFSMACLIWSIYDDLLMTALFSVFLLMKSCKSRRDFSAPFP